jgi:hypothetical protein
MAIFAGCVLSGAVIAAQPGFADLDVDHDGQLSRREASSAPAGSAVVTAFANLDADGDGRLSRSEYAALSSGRTGSTGTGVDSSSHSEDATRRTSPEDAGRPMEHTTDTP